MEKESLMINPAFGIRVEFIPKRKQRYETTGDWLWDGKTLTVRVNLMLDWRKQFLVAMHELTEAALCIGNGMTQEMVDDWDFEHSEEEEPGGMEGCPYRYEHEMAIKVEKILAEGFGIDFENYEKELGNEEFSSS